jgi:hypothetical protein
MKLNFKMILVLLTALLVFAGESSAALTQVFVAASFENRSTDKAISIGAGGNAGNYPNATGQIPNAGTVRLQRSAFGLMIAGNLGYPDAVKDLYADAQSLIASGTQYKTPESLGGEGQTGTGEIGTGAWDIRFPGSRLYSTGVLFKDGTDKQNYSESDLIKAAERYRAILFINPSDAEAAKGLLQTYYERMIPLIFAGNTAQVCTFRSRFAMNSLSYEIGLLDEGVAHYRNAAGVFVELTETPSDLKYLDGTAGAYSDYKTVFNYDALATPDSGDDMAIVPKVLETYARAVAFQAEALAHRVDRKYMDIFEYPVLPYQAAPKRRELVGYLHEQAAYIQNEILLANAYSHVFTTSDWLNVTDIGRASGVVSNLLSLRDLIRDGMVCFAIARNSTGAVTGESYGAYPPEYVPFLAWDPDKVIIGGTSYQNFYDWAYEIVTKAQAYQDIAKAETREFDANQEKMRLQFENIRTQYFSELGELCGRIRDSQDGQLYPDVVYALFPPEKRDEQHTYNESFGESKGSIHQQWLAIQQAETEVDAAMMDLENLVNEMDKKQEIAKKIAGVYENLAQLILNNGEKLAALAIQEGDLRAKQIEYENRKRRRSSIIGTALNKGLNLATTIGPSLLSGGMCAVFSPQFWLQIGTQAGTSTLSSLPDLANTYLNISTSNAIAANSADTARQLGYIQAQRERIRAFESASMQFAQRDIMLYQTEEALYEMVLRAERLKLNILLAEQREDMARAELSNMIGRVAFLLQEWSRSTYFATISPLNRADYRLILSLAMRDANEMFSYAQERCYLAAKTAEYRVNPDPGYSAIGNTIKNILKARRTEDLLTYLNGLKQDVYGQQMSQGAKQTDSLKLSVRHVIVQNNSIVTDADGNIIPSQSTFETQLDGSGNPSASQAVSDSDWLAFLKKHCDSETNPNKLEFAFSTSMIARAANPLHIPNSRGMLLSWNGDKPSEQNGVTINIVGRGLTIGADERVRINFKQEGSSVVRYKKWDTDPAAMRFWNLESVMSNVIAAVNGKAPTVLAGDTYRPSTPQFHERSPANDRWVFTIRGDMGGGVNAKLLNQLEKITDIEITFDVTYFTPASKKRAGEDI